MELKISIARESDYREEVIDHYNSIMNGRLLSLDLGKADDSDILSFISFYDENESYFNNCCSWLEIGEIGSSNYNGRDFQFINLLTKSGGSIQINFSQFIYIYYRKISDLLLFLINFFKKDKILQIIYIFCY